MIAGDGESVAVPSLYGRSQVFGFIRQEVGRAASNAAKLTPARDGEGGKAGGVGVEEGSGDAAAKELSGKRNVVLAELPRLMELDKVRQAARG